MPPHSRSVLVISLLGLLIGACAAIIPTPVDNFTNPQGIPYLDGSYYLLVWADGLGNLKWSLEFLADPQKKMEYRTSSDLSSVEATLTFSNGMLTKSNTTIDSTAVPKAVIGAVEKVLTAASDPAAGQNKVPGPRIYKLVVQGDTITFLGSDDQTQAIKVTVTSPPNQESSK